MVVVGGNVGSVGDTPPFMAKKQTNEELHACVCLELGGGGGGYDAQ